MYPQIIMFYKDCFLFTRQYWLKKIDDEDIIFINIIIQNVINNCPYFA